MRIAHGDTAHLKVESGLGRDSFVLLYKPVNQGAADGAGTQ
jgi:hypothetical protein